MRSTYRIKRYNKSWLKREALLEKANKPFLNKVADAFSQRLAKYLGKTTLAKVVHRNVAEKCPDIYHSYDFCDPNIFIAEAFEEIGLKSTAGWGKAWNLANSLSRIS